jgi:hypothetical protein
LSHPPQKTCEALPSTQRWISDPDSARSERDARSAGESFFTVRSTFAICQATELNSGWKKATRTLTVSVNAGAAQLGKGLGGGRRDAGMVGSLAVDDLFREPELEMATDPVDKLGAVATVKHVLD